MTSDCSIYLASGSPRRRELLALLDYPFDVLRIDVPEQQLPQETAAAYVQRLARDKSQAGWLACQGSRPVLGADTIVVFEQQVLEKPRDFSDARHMLLTLSGNTHTVMTAVGLSTVAGYQVILVESQVSFGELTEEAIEAYWRTGEPADKAGSYGIQGIGGKFVRHLSGSYSAVVGLPLFETEHLLHSYFHRS